MVVSDPATVLVKPLSTVADKPTICVVSRAEIWEVVKVAKVVVDRPLKAATGRLPTIVVVKAPTVARAVTSVAVRPCS